MKIQLNKPASDVGFPCSVRLTESTPAPAAGPSLDTFW